MKKKSHVERFFSYLTIATVLFVLGSLLYLIFFLEITLPVKLILGLSVIVILFLFAFLYLSSRISKQTVDTLENIGKNR